MLDTLTGYWLIGAPLGLWLSAGGSLGITGVWAGLAVGSAVTSGLMLSRLARLGANRGQAWVLAAARGDRVTRVVAASGHCARFSWAINARPSPARAWRSLVNWAKVGANRQGSSSVPANSVTIPGACEGRPNSKLPHVAQKLRWVGLPLPPRLVKVRIGPCAAKPCLGITTTGKPAAPEARWQSRQWQMRLAKGTPSAA